MLGRWTRTLVSMLVLLGAAAASAQPSTTPQTESGAPPPLSAFTGNYQISPGHIVYRRKRTGGFGTPESVNWIVRYRTMRNGS